jgi:hypothetical protein
MQDERLYSSDNTGKIILIIIFGAAVGVAQEVGGSSGVSAVSAALRILL